ncbi:MAG: hypothetical protein EFT35_03645 [Methanophagales archaeon ANME-1-THS]|nr:MAG: hypothetical protein EFT35_03645 [Methanophagales archaeon ANME-1-THS]
MGVLAKLKGMVGYKKYLNTLMLSAGLALLTLSIAFGLMYLATEGNSFPGPLMLLIFALFFVIFTVFYESSGKSKRKERESLKSLAKGLFLGCCATFAFVAVVSGVKLMILVINGELGEQIKIDWVIYAFAICMIVNTVLLSLLKPSPVKEKL